MIEDLIIATEAKKRRLVADTGEIERRYQEILKQYSSEENYKNSIKDAYGWSPEQTKKNIESEILKEKLSKEVLNGYDITSLYVRYDIYDLKAEPQKEEVVINKINSYYNGFQSGKTLEQIKQEFDSDKAYQHPMAGYAVTEGVNETNASNYFEGNEDWTNINGLQKASEYTKPYKSGGGYYAIAYANNVYKGEFNTWEEFLKSVAGKQLALSCEGKISKLARLLHISSASAHGPFCTYPRHYSRLFGSVTDANTGKAISGAHVQLTVAAGEFSDDHRSYRSHLCSGDADSVSDSTNANGDYNITRDGTAPNKRIQCAPPWDAYARASGYVTADDRINFDNGIDKLRNWRLSPVTHTLTIVKAGTGTGTVSVSQLSVAGHTLDCGNNCTRTYENDKEITVRATADSGSVFVSMTGDTESNPALTCNKSAADPTCKVRMGRDRTITVTFNTEATTYYWCPAGKNAPTPCSSGQYASAAACSSANGGATCSTSSSCSCPASGVSCNFSVAPTQGLSPLTVMLSLVYSPATLKVRAQMSNTAGENSWYGNNTAGLPSPYYYTYSSTGEKTITVQYYEGGIWKACGASTATVKVKSPSNSEGGEVAP